MDQRPASSKPVKKGVKTGQLACFEGREGDSYCMCAGVYVCNRELVHFFVLSWFGDIQLESFTLDFIAQKKQAKRSAEGDLPVFSGSKWCCRTGHQKSRRQSFVGLIQQGHSLWISAVIHVLLVVWMVIESSEISILLDIVFNSSRESSGSRKVDALSLKIVEKPRSSKTRLFSLL